MAAFFLEITARLKAEEERLELEARLRQQQKLESIGTLAAGVAHEINNPLNGILNFAQLILMKKPDNSDIERYAGSILRESERVSEIVKNLLAFSRQDRQTHSPARMQDITAATLSLVRALFARDQIAVEADVPADLPSFKCRSQQIQQVLLNLLTNARDATNERFPASDAQKRIRIETRLVTREGRNWLRTIVEDHGSGIPAELRGRIFDPFFTTKPKDVGTGLGLSVSYGIVRDHHGELTFESSPGHGTRFFLDLPVDNGWTLDGKDVGPQGRTR
jgi:signal transduction histidine kinase